MDSGLPERKVGAWLGALLVQRYKEWEVMVHLLTSP